MLLLKMEINCIPLGALLFSRNISKFSPLCTNTFSLSSENSLYFIIALPVCPLLSFAQFCTTHKTAPVVVENWTFLEGDNSAA